MKRFLAVTLALLVLLLPAAVLAQSSAREDPLSFGSDGKFTIMVMADLQTTQFVPSRMTDAMYAVLDEVQPDLVVLLGDQVDGGNLAFQLGDATERVRAAIDQAIEPLVTRAIPFAVVFGNHDSEMGVSRELQMEWYMNYPNCLAVDDELPWCGTYYLPIYGSDGVHKLGLYCIDSGDYDGQGNYAYVSTEQIDWCAQEAAKHPDVPALAFQHIIVPEIYTRSLTECAKDDPTALSAVGLNNVQAYYSSASGSIVAGELMEAPCPPAYNNGQYDGWVAQGDILAAFFGHDHNNSFTAVVEGGSIPLIACPASTFTSYADAACRGVRVIEISEEDPADYETYLLHYEDYGYSGPSTLYIWIAVAGVAILMVLAGVVLAIVLPIKAKKRRSKSL